MKMHDTEILETRNLRPDYLEPTVVTTLARTRVPGGWMYHSLDYLLHQSGLPTQIAKTSVFVPMHWEETEKP